MTATARDVLRRFDSLDASEKRQVADEIARRSAVPGNAETEEDILAAASVRAATQVLPVEDFSDWED